MAPTKHTTTGLLANVAKSSAVRDTSTKFGMTKKELPKNVKWLQKHWVTKGVVSGPTCRKKKNSRSNFTAHFSKMYWCNRCGSEFFFTYPAAIFTPSRHRFIPVFALGSNGSDSDSGVDRFDAWLYNRLNNKVMHSSISTSVFGTQHPDIFFLCVCAKTHTCKLKRMCVSSPVSWLGTLHDSL